MVDKSSKLDKFSSNMNAATGSTAANLTTGNVASGNLQSSGLSSTGTGGVCLSSGSSHHYHSHQNGQKPVPMKLFAAWEVDRTPPNCIPRLCSLTITRLSILTPLPSDMTSLSLAVKMQSSKRTLRSHEIPISVNSLLPTSGANMQSSGSFLQQLSNYSPSSGGGVGGGGGGGGIGGGITNVNNLPVSGTGSGNNVVTLTSANMANNSANVVGGGCNSIALPLYETELDLHFSLQYPHFIKRDGNRLVILLQRRKKYKSRTILGYKTLAEGIIRMDAVLQKSMDMTVELIASGKNGRPGTVVACLRAERVCSIPVDHDNKNNNSVLLADRVAEYSDDDEEAEFSSGEFNDEPNELGIPGYDPKRDYNPAKHDMRKYRKQLQRTEVEDVNLGTQPVDSDSEFEMKDKSSSRAKISRTISLQQRNFKQKIVALLKRFKASEELEGEGNRTTAALRGERDLDAFFQELESLSCCEGDDSGPDMDSLSIGSTPKPSLRPFFTNSRIMLHENNLTGNNERRSSDKSEQLTNLSFNFDNNKQKCIHLTNNNNNLATTPADRVGEYRNDSSGNEGNAFNTDGQNSDGQNSPPRHQYTQQVVNLANANTTTVTPTPPANEKRSRLFRTSSSTPGTGGLANIASGKKKQTLSLSAEPRSVLETCLSPTNVEPRKLLLDQLSRAFASEDTILPEVVTIIGPPEAISGSPHLAKLTILFANSFKPAFVPQNTAEVKAVLQALMGKIQKYCNSNAKPPNTVKILLIGGDWLQGATLRHYVELMGVRPPDWLNHLRFYIVPIGNCTVARYLSHVDQAYAMMFGSENWYQLCERVAATVAAVSAVTTVNATLLSSSLADVATANKSDIVEIITRIQRYLYAAGPCTQLPIAEAMVNYKDEDSCQIFVPFVSDVRIGYLDGPQASLDLEDSINATNLMLAVERGGGNSQLNTSSTAIPIGSGNSSSSNLMGGTASAMSIASNSGGSPPQGGRISPPLQTPPSSASLQRERGGDVFNNAVESVELQVDYWPLVRPGDHSSKEKSITRSSDQGGKNSIKSTFRNLQVWRLPQNAQFGDMSNGLTVSFATKEKKQKQIMRLGKKKEKDRDLEKEQCVEGVARLICSPKQSHPVPLRVTIDGTEWTGVKFFQLSSQWQTHVKNFPIALIGCLPMSCSEIS